MNGWGQGPSGLSGFAHFSYETAESGLEPKCSNYSLFAPTPSSEPAYFQVTPAYE